MSEGKLREEAERGEQARAVLDNPAYVLAWGRMRQELIDIWVRSETGNAEARERVWLSVRLLDRLKAEFEKTMRSGRLSAAELIQIEEQKRRKRNTA